MGFPFLTCPIALQFPWLHLLRLHEDPGILSSNRRSSCFLGLERSRSTADPRDSRMSFQVTTHSFLLFSREPVGAVQHSFLLHVYTHVPVYMYVQCVYSYMCNVCAYIRTCVVCAHSSFCRCTYVCAHTYMYMSMWVGVDMCSVHMHIPECVCGNAYSVCTHLHVCM